MYDDILGPRKKCQWEDDIIYTPYIPLQITKIAVKAKSRKLKTKWFFENNRLVNEKQVLKEMNEC